MHNFIRKTLAITISIMLFVSVNSYGALYPVERRNEKDFIKIALNMDSIIENDLIEMRNREVVEQAYKMKEEACGPTKEDLEDLSLLDLYYINPKLLKKKIAYMKVRDARKEIKEAITHFSHLYEMDEHLIMAIVKKESYFNPKARSYKNAKGLMQLMPATAVEMGVKDVFNPFENLEGGIKYFKLMLAKFGSEKLALAAYNAGPYNVIKHRGIPPFSETRDYVKSILEFRKEYNDTYERTI